MERMNMEERSRLADKVFLEMEQDANVVQYQTIATEKGFEYLPKEILKKIPKEIIEKLPENIRRQIEDKISD